MPFKVSQPFVINGTAAEANRFELLHAESSLKPLPLNLETNTKVHKVLQLPDMAECSVCKSIAEILTPQSL